MRALGRIALGGCAAALVLAAAAAAAAAADGAVVIMYHRFGEPDFPSTNISIARLEAHLGELSHGPYKVLPLPRIVEALRRGAELPERTVGISIDDAYASAYTEAWPRLRAAGLPFTLFVATDPVDRGGAGTMTWDQVRELAGAGVTIGSQTASHLHMAGADPSRSRIDIAKSNQRFAAELGRRPRLFAYPYGEASLAAAALVRASGFVAAFGQHSGVVAAGEDLFFLPRFAMNEKYGDLARLRLALNALPLAVTDLTPADPLIGALNPPPIGFTVTSPRAGLGRLACFASHSGRARIERLGEQRFEVRALAPFPKGRTRLNCTLPAAGGRWHWFGRQFYVP